MCLEQSLYRLPFVHMVPPLISMELSCTCVNDWNTVIDVRVLKMITDCTSFGCYASRIVVYRVHPCIVNHLYFLGIWGGGTRGWGARRCRPFNFLG